ncbi:DUF4147 domain-containing protein [Patescibacteria group bacterium]|nr:DUF4147 domain-containing protein [Patescibacteria group bacterium]MBU1673065.1 DUF4147 domain-containing protein [Patescibacteria group bacterium]MBU1963671.1 DUF4147 domain-containing protein [Patescibacteria group bacterium]
MIKNKQALKNDFPEAGELLDFAEIILKAIEPKKLVRENFPDTSSYNNIFVVGAGKASLPMAEETYKILGKKIKAGHINVPDAYQNKIGPISVTKAGHPHPTASGVSGAKKILKICEKAQEGDLVIALISGGGSALLPLPAEGLTLKEKIKLTDDLLKCGANIKEINTIRKHASKIKGGRLAEAAMPATLIGLYISDVIGDPLDMIASGPTVADPTTSQDAARILKKYCKKRNKKLEKIVLENESPKSLPKGKVKNFIIGSNKLALEAIKNKCDCRVLTSELEGEAREVAKMLIKEIKKMEKPALLIAGGETTVTVRGKGHGGRNQELVLAAIPKLEPGICILSLATDGVDGLTPQPMAGAVACYNSQKICHAKGLKISEFLNKSDSYNCLKKIHGHLITGPTGTNVGDIILIKNA